MVADKFRSIFSKKKEKNSDEKIVQELHDILEGLEEARAEQLLATSMVKEKKEEGEAPVSVEEEKEVVDLAREEEKKKEEKEKRTRKEETAPAVTDSKTAKEVKVDKQALTTTYIMSTISTLFEAFKSEFLEYVINKSLTDQRTRDLLFKSLEKLDKRDLIEIVRIIYKIVDERLGTGLKVPEVSISQATPVISSSSSSISQPSSQETGRTMPKEAQEATPPAEGGKEKEEEVDLSSLLGEL
ncbi:MAG: hypothetical protein GXO10_06435 [Crenarchaeota archaeon]|nr:hypothetical protein [Thermoproteota archaeon]